MRPLDKKCYSYITNGAAASGRPQRTNPEPTRPKPTPSKWDDAQKWLVGMSSGRADRVRGCAGAARPRNSNADERRLLGSSSQNGRVSCSSVDVALGYSMVVTAPPTPPLQGEGADDVGETKKIDCMVQQHGSPVAEIRSVCLRDMGTEMTPIASKEPSRTATPLRASTPVARSPISSRSSTPARRRQERPMAVTTAVVGTTTEPVPPREEGPMDAHVPSSANSLESRAAAWDEAELAKYTAR